MSPRVTRHSTVTTDAGRLIMMTGSLQMAGDGTGLQPAASPHGNFRQAPAVGSAPMLAPMNSVRILPKADSIVHRLSEKMASAYASDIASGRCPNPDRRIEQSGG